MRSALPVLLPLVLAAGIVVPSASSAQMRPAAPITAFEVTPYTGYLIPGAFVDGPFGTSIGAAPAAMIGTQLGVRLSPNVALVANVATGSSDVKAGIPILGGVSVGRSRMVVYDAGLQLDLPMATLAGTSFSPFVQGGVGGASYELTQSFLTLTSTSLAGNLGLGADVSVGSGVGLRVMAKDYISRFDFKEATTLDIDADVSHSVALSVGVRFSF